jgi:hypothetical protein
VLCLTSACRHCFFERRAAILTPTSSMTLKPDHHPFTCSEPWHGLTLAFSNSNSTAATTSKAGSVPSAQTEDAAALVAARDVEFGGTVLHWAAAVGDEEIVRLLLLKGADTRVGTFTQTQLSYCSRYEWRMCTESCPPIYRQACQNIRVDTSARMSTMPCYAGSRAHLAAMDPEQAVRAVCRQS